MKTILLVDDEYPAIEAIRTCVDWEKLGIGRVLTADSVGRAREHFEGNDIELLLCDIEMPGENGLDLLQWIKTHSPDTVGIFLTCHADFKYARDAVRMGAFDYLLKPASIEDIERVIGEAQQEWEKRHSGTVLRGMWNKNKSAVLERFWQDILNNLMPDSRELISQQVETRKLAIDTDRDYLVVICVIRKWHRELSVWEEYDLDFTVRNILEELYGYTDACVITDTTGRKLVVLDCGRQCMEAVRQASEAAGRFQDFLKEHFYTKSCFYIGNPCKIERLAGNYRRLCEVEKNNVSYDDTVFFLENAPGSHSGPVFDSRETDRWKELLTAGKADELCIAIKRSLRQMVAEGTMDGESLLMFYHEAMQAIYTALAGCHISVQQLPESMREEYSEAFGSIEGMARYLEHVIRASVKCIDDMKHQEGVVGRIKQYIEENLGEDLNRDILAKQVYLNPNYLARIFRNKTGSPLVDYITERRMERVKQLLLTTDLSVTQIAQQLGYTNMPYFSRVFKKETGCTPIEYRKMNGGGAGR